MITYLKINGFKSFHNFEMEFTPLTIVASDVYKRQLLQEQMLLGRVTCLMH